MPARRATKDTLMPGCMASSTSRTFSAADHRRRRCTEVMTSNREIGPPEGVVIVVIIGLRLCLISYAECPVEKGGSSAVWPLGTVTWVLLVSGMDYHKHHDRPFSEYCRRRRVDLTKGIHGEDPETALKRISPVLQLMTAGIILFHAIYPRSVEALKLLLQRSSTNSSLRFVPLEKAASIRPKC